MLLLRLKMLCPRCVRNAIVYEPWGKNDLVAVCRAVRRCGWRMHMPKMARSSKNALDKYVQIHGPISLRA